MAGGKPGPAPVPISRHPLFPAIVALWFGALFGLGSLAIRPSLIEAIVLKFHIDSLISAAAPPLGMTARIVLALALAVIGGATGAKIARWIARPKLEQRQRKRAAFAKGDEARDIVSVRSRDAHPDAPARRPFSAADDMGSPASDEHYGLVRRRSLTIEQDFTPADFHELAPLPGGAPQILDRVQVSVGQEPLELKVEAVAVDAASQRQFDAEFVRQEFVPPPVEALRAEAAVLRQTFGEPQPEAEGSAAESAPIAVSPALAEAVMEISEEVKQDEAPAPPPPAMKSIVLPTDKAAERLIAAPMDTLGPVELVERLALALQRKRAVAGMSAPVAAVEPPVAHSGAAAQQNFVNEPTPVPPPMALPASMQPVPLDDEDDGDDTDLATIVPPRMFAQPVAADGLEADDVAAAADGSEDISDEELDDGYSSLLDISLPPAGLPTPVRQQFIRVEAPEPESGAIEPVVIFPGQNAAAAGPADAPRRFDVPSPVAAIADGAAPRSHGYQHDSEETQRALRAALANLQRMSGAA